MPELIDIVDTTNKIIGKTDKKTAHREGLWHRTVCFLIVDSKKKLIYFQDRSTPSQLKSHEFFVKLNGGHLLAGEKVSQGIRELKEELGLILEDARFFPIGINQTAVDFSEEYKLREFMYFFIVDIENILNKVKFLDGEVQSLISFDPEQALKVVLGKSPNIKAAVFDGDKITELLLSANNFKNFTDDNLYLRIFITVKRYFSGEPKEYLVI